MSKELVERLREDWEMLKDGFQDNLTRTWHDHAMGNAAMDCSAAADEIERLNGIIEAAKEWADARLSFISLGGNDPSSRHALNRLSDAENALCILSKAHKVKE